MKRSRALFDIAVLAVYLLAANPVLTGIPLHEFLGLGAFVMVAAHVVVSGEGLGGRGRVGQLVLNAVLLLALAVCVVSGVMVSGTVLPSWGCTRRATTFGIRFTRWRPRCSLRPCSCMWSCALPPRWRFYGNAGVFALRKAIA